MAPEHSSPSRSASPDALSWLVPFGFSFIIAVLDMRSLATQRPDVQDRTAVDGVEPTDGQGESVACERLTHGDPEAVGTGLGAVREVPTSGHWLFPLGWRAPVWTLSSSTWLKLNQAVKNRSCVGRTPKDLVTPSAGAEGKH